MAASRLIFLVEEPSMEAFLRAWLPRVVPPERTFEIHAFQGKRDLLGKLESRLRAYASWLPADWRIVVVVDRDADDCRALKAQMEGTAAQAGLTSRSIAGGHAWRIVTRIAIEELEAWYFGDWPAVCAAFPRVPSTVPQRDGFRDSDAIAGGTWEAFERILKRHGHFAGGLQKIAAARAIGELLQAEQSTSASFHAFHAAIGEALA